MFVCLFACSLQYQLYGEQVVKACISQRTNYVDITGETYVREEEEGGEGETRGEGKEGEGWKERGEEGGRKREGKGEGEEAVILCVITSSATFLLFSSWR